MAHISYTWATVDPGAPSVVNIPFGIPNAAWTLLSNVVCLSGLTRLCTFAGITDSATQVADTFDYSVATTATGSNCYAAGFTDTLGGAPTVRQTALGTAANGIPTATLAALASGSWVQMAAQIGRLPTGAPDAGWTERMDASYITPANGMWVIDSNAVTTDNTPSGTWSTGSWDSAAVEIQPAGLGPVRYRMVPVPGRRQAISRAANW